MADEQHVIAVLALDGLRSGDEGADQMFSSTKLTWLVHAVDIPDLCARCNAAELLKRVFSESSRPVEFGCKAEFEWEDRGGFSSSILFVLGHV